MSQLEFGPILRALMRNKVGALLIAIQIAFTMTIVVNAVFIVVERSEKMQRESGIDEANSFLITSVGFGEDFDRQASVTEDLLMLRQMPGIANVVQTNAAPLTNSGWSMGLQTEPGEEIDGTGTAVYMVDEHALNTLDVELIAGENFAATDIRWREGAQVDWPDTTIITKALAETLYPDEPWQSVVGRTLYISDDQPIIVQGIVDKLQAPWVGWDGLENVMLSPEKTLFSSARYLIRTEPGMRDQVMPQVEEALASSNTSRIIRRMRSIEESRERAYRGDAAMINILTITMITLTLVTALGIVGLASFSVNRRKKQIGTRRALGASQGAIVRYFMLENFIISTVGVALGTLLTISLNILLVNMFSLNPLDWFYIPIGIVALWLVGQIAAFGPAKKAAAIPPAVATRTV